jgi:hypothetical protein
MLLPSNVNLLNNCPKKTNVLKYARINLNLMKTKFAIMGLLGALLLVSGCYEEQSQPTQEVSKGPEIIEKNVSFTGEISKKPEQHMIDIPEDYPFSEYFDTDKLQYVIYSKERINCAGELTVKGSIIQITGTSKKPGSNEVYKENEILVDSFECAQPTKNVEPEPLTAADETEDWLDYSNEELMFSLKYPEQMFINEDLGTYVSFQLWGPTQEPNTEFYDGVSMNFSKGSYEGALSFEDFVNSQADAEAEIAEWVSEPKPMSLAGIYGYQLDIISMGEYTNYYLPIDDINYLLISIMTADPTNQGYKSKTAKILQTLEIYY